MRINKGIRVGKYIRLYRDNGNGPNYPIEPTLLIDGRASGMSVRLPEDVRLALIDALQDPSVWPLRYDLVERAK